MGGEKFGLFIFCQPLIGSPPHGRGKAYIFPTFWGVERITPAWAGKRRLWLADAHSDGDHPRMGGEKEENQPGPNWELGSPPHGRGKVRAGVRPTAAAGITPAWAGKSSAPLCCGSESGDHPRMGGEKSFIYPFPFFRQGSPPHGRGKVCTCCCASPLARITPAWAGKSLRVALWLLDTRGSPPHGRGKDRGRMALAHGHRITPAWAGKSRSVPNPADSCEDHPRMGGEKWNCLFANASALGSPPHGRGKVV